MSSCLPILGLLAPALLALSAPSVLAADKKHIPTIAVMLYFQTFPNSTSGGSLIGTTMPVVNGKEKTWDGQIGDPKNEICRIQGKCKTVRTSPGHFRVQVHYSIYLDASKKTIAFDRLLTFLPVGRDPQGELITPDPEGPGWTCVDHNIYTAAYFIDPTITMRD